MPHCSLPSVPIRNPCGLEMSLCPCTISFVRPVAHSSRIWYLVTKQRPVLIADPLIQGARSARQAPSKRARFPLSPDLSGLCPHVQPPVPAPVRERHAALRTARGDKETQALGWYAGTPPVFTMAFPGRMVKYGHSAGRRPDRRSGSQHLLFSGAHS